MFHVLKLIDQRLLRAATQTRIPFDRALVHHDREREAGVILSLRHHEFCCIVDLVIRTIPIDDDSIDAAADHVGDLVSNLHGIARTVTIVHVVRFAEPKQKMRVDLSCRALIEQSMNVNFAHVIRADVSVCLRGKAAGSTRVV